MDLSNLSSRPPGEVRGILYQVLTILLVVNFFRALCSYEKTQRLICVDIQEARFHDVGSWRVMQPGINVATWCEGWVDGG